MVAKKIISKMRLLLKLKQNSKRNRKRLGKVKNFRLKLKQKPLLLKTKEILNLTLCLTHRIEILACNS